MLVDDILAKLYLTLIVQQALKKLENEQLSFINIYCSEKLYNYLADTKFKLDNNKIIYFKLDLDKNIDKILASFDLESDKNIINSDDFFE